MLLAVSAMTVLCLCACGGSSGGASTSAAGGDAVNPSDFTTLGQALVAEHDGNMAQWDSKQYVYVYTNGDEAYRVTAEMTAEIDQKLQDTDASKEDYNEQVYEILKDQKVTKVEDLTAGVPSQEEHDKEIGKTAKEVVMDDGYELTGNMYFDNKVQATFDKGLYEYTAEFNETPKDPENFNGDVEIPDMTVKSFTYSGISSNATDVTLEP
jgi:hypothetical protein